MKVDFKFKVGQAVDIYDGWELPLIKKAIVTNRKQLVISNGQGYAYVNQYLVAGQKAVFKEEDLKECQEG